MEKGGGGNALQQCMTEFMLVDIRGRGEGEKIERVRTRWS